MLKEITIRAHKVLKTCCLPDLGKINIICGRNNSGKSTLLEAIYSHRIGGSLTYEEWDSLQKEVDILIDKYIGEHKIVGFEALEEINDTRMSLYEFMTGSDYVSHVVDFDGKDVIYGEEHFNYDQKKFDDFFNQIRKKGIYLKAKDLMLSIEELVRDKLSFYESVLIPAKRKIDHGENFKSQEKVLPDGHGIINQLFSYKNRTNANENVFVQELHDAFKKLSSGYDFDVFLDNQNNLDVYFSQDFSNWVRAFDSGIGLQELLIILYFSLKPGFRILLIEEPENHMHPDMQRKLVNFLGNIRFKQFFLTTHSNIFLNSSAVDKVLLTRFDKEVKVEDVTSRAIVLHELGYSVTDNLLSDLVILVEGITDIQILEEFLTKMDLLARYNIKMWPLSGDMVANKDLDLSVFVQNYSLIALLDSDPESTPKRDTFKKKCDEYGIEHFTLERYSIENYLTVAALRFVFKADFPSNIASIASDKKLKKQIGIDVKGKGNLRRIAKHMKLSDLSDTDLYRFLCRIDERCKASEQSK